MKKLFLFSFMVMSLFAFAQTDFIQTDWSGGAGQAVFTDNTKFNSSFHVDFSSFPGDLIAENDLKTHVYGVVEYNGKLLITTGWTGTYIYDPITLEWEFSHIAVTINYKNNTIHSDGLLYVLQGYTIYRYDGTHNDYGMGANGWELHSDISSGGYQSIWTIKSVQDKLLIGCRVGYTARVIEWKEATQSWNQMGNAFTQGVCSLIDYNGTIYAGTHWSGKVYKWTGSSWIYAFSTGSMSIVDLEIHDGLLYLAGATNLSSGALYKYDGNNCTRIESFNAAVWDLESHGDILAFTMRSNYISTDILQYNGSSVSTLYTLNGERTSWKLCSFQGDLYYGGLLGTTTSVLYKNGSDFETIYVKGVFSSEFPTANGVLNVDATIDEGSGVKIFVQGKNNPNYTASPWIEIPEGQAVPISDAVMRYWAILYTVGEGPSPILHELSIGYQNEIPLEVSLISKTDIMCNGEQTGAIDISVSGGAEPYAFLWSNGAITEDLNNVLAGTYSVLVTDGNANTITDDFILFEPDVLAISCPEDINLNSLENECGAYANFVATVTGGTNPTITYSQNSGSLFPVGTTVVTVVSSDNCGSIDCAFNVHVIDDIAPVALCQDISLTLLGGTVSVSPEMLDNGSSDACGIASLDLDITSFNCSNIGDNPVVLAVTDMNGNVSSCESIITVLGDLPSCEINVELENDIYTGGDGQTIFIGYGPQSLTAHVLAQGGGPFTYSWTGGSGFLSSTSSSNPVFSPTVGGYYTLSCTVTNSYGCITDCEVDICVKDIRAGGNGNNSKVYLCHVPNGNPNKAKTLKISVNAVPRHLNNHEGDHLGRCDQECGALKMDIYEEDSVQENEPVLHVYPNPTMGLFNFFLDSHCEESYSLEVFDQLGRKCLKLEDLRPNSEIQFGNDFPNGFYYLFVIQDEFVQTIKIIKTD